MWSINCTIEKQIVFSCGESKMKKKKKENKN